jgi:hypothetical protein
MRCCHMDGEASCRSGGALHHGTSVSGTAANDCEACFARLRHRKAGSADRAFGQGRLDDERTLASASPSRRRGSDVAAVYTRASPPVRRQKRRRPHEHPSGRSSGRRRVQWRTWYPTRFGEDGPAFGQTQTLRSVSRRTPSGGRSDTRRALRGT